MKIAFVHGSPYGFGGIETWLMRFSERLVADGHEVALLTRPFGEEWHETTGVVDRISRSATIHVGTRHWFRERGHATPPLAGADVLFACNLEALLRAALLQQRLDPAPRVVAGAFSPREYCWKASRMQRRWIQHLAERVVLRLPLENFVFATDGMARQTGECIGRDLSASPVLPLAIDTERFRPSPNRRVDRRKIVSVSRLVPYYTHHRHMIRVIRDLRESGHGFTYHAFGDGPERQRLEDDARRMGVDDAVFLHGAIPYDNFGDAVGDAFAYIGMGTALIEAAACGVPALVAIDSHPAPVTYGFIDDTVGNDIGGYVPGHPEHEIGERLLWLAGLTEQQYRQVEDGARARVEEFSLTRLVPRFVDMLAGAAPVSIPISAADRVLAQLDWMVEAVLLNLGAPDVMTRRYVRPLTS